MRDVYLRNVCVQSAVYALTILTWSALSVLAGSGPMSWGTLFVVSIYTALLAMPFWLVDVLLLRPVLKFAGCSAVLWGCELAALLANWTIVRAPGLLRGGPDQLAIWRDILVTSLALSTIYFALGCLLRRAFNGRAAVGG